MRGEYFLFRLAAAAVGVLPEAVVGRGGSAVGRAVTLWSNRRKKMVERHQRRVNPEQPAPVSEVFGSYGRYWAEVFWLRPRRRAAVLARIEVEGLDLVLEARDAGKGMILALPHIGNWEVAGLIAAREGIHIVAVAEALANRRVADWFVDLRASLGIEVVLADGSSRVMRRLIEAVRQGHAVALLSDRDLSRNGVETEFFGELTTLPGGPIALALTTGAPVFPVASYFSPGRGHVVVVKPSLDLPEADDRDRRISLGTERLAKALEELIRRAPGQWHLVQPNWPSDRGR